MITLGLPLVLGASCSGNEGQPTKGTGGASSSGRSGAEGARPGTTAGPTSGRGGKDSGASHGGASGGDESEGGGLVHAGARDHGGGAGGDAQLAQGGRAPPGTGGLTARNGAGHGEAGSGGEAGAGGETDGPPEPCVYPRYPSPEEANIVLLRGHADILSFRLGCPEPSLDIVVTEDFPLGFGQKVHRTLESVLIAADGEAQLELPNPAEAPGYEDLGPAGKSIWLLPEVQLDAVVWPGWNAYEVPAGVVDKDTLEVTLVRAEGPGTFHAFASSLDGKPDWIFHPERGISSTTIRVGAHVHMNWAFSEAGSYALTFRAKLRTRAGRVLESAERSLRFFFGDLTDLPRREPTVLRIDGLQESYAPTDRISLQAAPFGAPSSAEVVWSEQCFDFQTLESSVWTKVGTGAALELPASRFPPPDRQSCQLRASLMDGDTESATSQPVLPLIQ
ncbi:MAG TPA: choice-of-anchor M domain-containing protein [Polyangiaceae bacterium]|nr:choice-of-anchor M domain-containing protein [Polyangiaceae bacterium]